jgi:putative Mg2+ transporter-C (MgtC) family protein
MEAFLPGAVIDGPAFLRLDLLFRLILAAVLGGVVGLEREVSGKPAGLRTNILICVGATLLTELSVALAGPGVGVSADQTRIAAQIVSGIGFLGAGTIIQARGSVVGLTTAATLWVVAAIGMAVGARAYVEAVGTTVLVIVVLILLGRIEGHFIQRRRETVLRVMLDPEPGSLQRVEELLTGAGLTVETLEAEKRAGAVVASLAVTGPRRTQKRVVRELAQLAEVRKVTRLPGGS